MTDRPGTRLAAMLVGSLLVAGCDLFGRPPSEYSAVDRPPSGTVTVPYVQTTDFQAGRYVQYARVVNPFADGANEGRQYYMAFNCAGCHGGQGGGGIGPPFLVPDFIYGGDAGNIFQSIIQGRPQGMPAYGGKAPDEVIWKIVAYVQSLAEPYRRDDDRLGAGTDREHGNGGQ
jgi:cytochrome c oxidase cbb3-type subunit III